jgi:hypothetical protein
VNKEIKAFNSKLKKIGKIFNHVTILEFSSNRNLFKQHGLHLNGFGKGLLPKQTASLIYTRGGKKTEEPISLKWKTELNENATTHIAKKVIVIPTTIALDPKTQSDTVTCTTSIRTKRPPVTRQNVFCMVKDILSLEESNICNQYGSSSSFVS